ncbi:adenylate/guanylate cyclase domain-containing protein [Terasakiella sp. A23]|uniref:adenylate/guanylate cyclase domain-containing protein n=1 Tax=Terasakiella sp. FCG-A23 TaxID=3080561 RepID=UPI002955D208|nr:adenylate/guanylate cyclase domain-containing protein [Terasakiella sp. A23]MDV7339620.1 adenylate/guanylate cyclase domain-containing protein [Terasakiella sp. A23]
MAFEIFKKEKAIIDAAKALLETDDLPDDAKAPYQALLKDYEKLFKSTKRLVRLSDRNEAELNKLANNLDDKNKTLENLSQNLSKYLSPQIYDSIFSGDREVRLKTDRKKLTVFFSDLKDFTATSENLQPEDLNYLLNKYFTAMTTIALEHGATIDKFIGDAMLLFVGDPQSNGVIEDAKACVRMAIAMQRKMEDLKDMWINKGFAKPFRMRIGINTGYCNVGNFGSDHRMDYTIIGGEVNLAARLEQSSDTDGILLSAETYALVKDIVDAEEREPIHVKGIQREVRTYAVKGIYDDIDKDRRFIHKERRGLTCLLDIDKIPAEEKDEVVKELETLIMQVKSS